MWHAIARSRELVGPLFDGSKRAFPRHFLFLVVACGIALSLAAAASPQEPKKSNGSSKSTAKKTQTQASDPRISNPLVLIIRDSGVQTELGLKAEQKRAVREALDEVDGMLWSIRDTDAEAGGKVYQAATESVENKLRGILTATQQKRLDQLIRQGQGPTALVLPEVAERVALSAEQRKKVREIFDAKSREINELAKNKMDLKERQEKTRKIRRDGQEQLLDVLNQAQRKEWSTLIGKPFDLSHIRPTAFKAPQLVPGEWINSAPLTLEELQGQVVALHFWTFG